MRYLYIDTSSSYLYSAIVEDSKLLAEIKEEYGQSLSEVALPRIVSMFDKLKFTAKDIDKILVVNGPGSFTGIRIGVTIAKVYAWSLKLPISTILSLEAMAVSSNQKKYHVPIINARRGYVFGAIYNNDEVVLEEQYMTIEKLKLVLMGMNKKYVFISNDKFNDLEVVGYDPDILKIINTYKNREPINPHFVNPIYLKLTEAEENRLKDN